MEKAEDKKHPIKKHIIFLSNIKMSSQLLEMHYKTSN